MSNRHTDVTLYIWGSKILLGDKWYDLLVFCSMKQADRIRFRNLERDRRCRILSQAFVSCPKSACARSRIQGIRGAHILWCIRRFTIDEKFQVWRTSLFVCAWSSRWRVFGRSGRIWFTATCHQSQNGQQKGHRIGLADWPDAQKNKSRLTTGRFAWICLQIRSWRSRKIWSDCFTHGATVRSLWIHLLQSMDQNLSYCSKIIQYPFQSIQTR